ERAGEIARQAGIGFVALSHEVSPLPRFVPRAETTLADAYLTPVLSAYVERLARLTAGAPLFFMTSGGTLSAAGSFRGRDAVLSGPAGGVLGMAEIARRAGASRALGVDMGGTSTDVCRWAGRTERRERATTAGVRLRAPRLDVETVAAGGGSILGFDGLRARVGPASAGARPGPAAYGLGGPPTVTDAALVAGRLDPTFFPAIFGPRSDSPLDAAASLGALAALAQVMGLESPEAAAEGFLAVAVEQAAGAIRKISTERGFDPRRHALLAFGGAAGQFACAIAGALGISQVLCPAEASVLSAFGIGRARLSALRQTGLERGLDSAGLRDASFLADRLEAACRAELETEGARNSVAERRLALRYAESDAVLPVSFGPPARVRSEFEAAHRRLFGFVEPDRQILIASVEVEASEAAARQPGAAQSLAGQESLESDPPSQRSGTLRAQDMTGPIEGPRLIARADTQIFTPAGWRAEPHEGGLISLHRTGLAARRSRANGGAADPITLELYNRRFTAIAEA
ncbi:MAG: hydantoinase/oxoprolinase family protein, partial [Caulobacteraceae bacterium]